jgi:hypothetical protein
MQSPTSGSSPTYAIIVCIITIAINPAQHVQLSLAQAHVDAASFAQGHPSASTLSSLTISAPAPLPALTDRSELPRRSGASFSLSRLVRDVVSREFNERKTETRGGGESRYELYPVSDDEIPPSPTSSTTTTTIFSCSSAASLELKLVSFPAPPSTPPHVLLRVR